MIYKSRFNQRRSKDEWHVSAAILSQFLWVMEKETEARRQIDGGINTKGEVRGMKGRWKEKTSEMCEAGTVKTPEKSWPTLQAECRAVEIDVNAAPADIAEVSPLVLHTASTPYYPALWLQLLLKQKHITASLIGVLTKARTEVSKLFHNGTLLWTQMYTEFTKAIIEWVQQPCASLRGFSHDMLFLLFHKCLMSMTCLPLLHVCLRRWPNL